MAYIDIPKENLTKLNELHNAVKGTSKYSKYLMETCAQKEGTDPKRWFFIGWCIPNDYKPAKYRKHGNNIYVYQGEYRYTLSSNADAFNVLVGK